MIRRQPVRRHSPRHGHGFTLLEVLLATLLLSMGLALAFAILRSSQSISSRGETIAARSERMRVVHGFLGRQLQTALPIAHQADADPARRRFTGEAQRMHFVADLPGYLGVGGPHLHELEVAGEGELHRLQLRLIMLEAGKPVSDSQTPPPELLVERIDQGRFRYRGTDPHGQIIDWQTEWPWPERLPLQVEIVIEPMDGPPWPPLVVTLPRPSAGAFP